MLDFDRITGFYERALDGVAQRQAVIGHNVANQSTPGFKAKRVHFLFNAKPDAVLGEGRCAALRLEKTRIEDGRAVGTGEFFEIPCGLVVPAIGYQMAPIEGLALDSATGGIANREI